MHIEPSDNLINGRANGGFGWCKIGRAGEKPAGGDDAGLRGRYAEILAEAGRVSFCEPAGPDAVAQARRQMEAGEFDRKEVLTAAAVNMLKLGI